jgi:hypothetical protein
MVGGDPLTRDERITGRPDPDVTPRPALTSHTLDAWAAAAYHLLSHGLTPAVPAEVARALHQRSGPDRALAVLLARRGGVA